MTVSGELRKTDPEATAHLVMAALIEAGLLIATARDRVAARTAAGPPFMAMLEGLRA
jgi:glutamine synthetase